jgi:uncharacterized protein YjbI with pentapeptide repeats
MSDQVQRPTSTEDRAGWKTCWAAQGMAWRTEPEIDEARQMFLAERRAATPNYQRATYPFAGINLARADIEWLLAHHEDEGVRGPVVDTVTVAEPADPPNLSGIDLQELAVGLLLSCPSGQWEGEPGLSGPQEPDMLLDSDMDEQPPARWGLDLRGADLRGADLSNLPLERLWGGLYGDWWREASIKQREAAAVLLEGADLRRASFAGAFLRNANLSGVQLQSASLQFADLREATLEGANLDGADCACAEFFRANLQGTSWFEAYASRAGFRNANLRHAILSEAVLWGAELRGAHLEEADLRRADLRRADLTGASLVGAVLRDADLRGAHLARAKLDGANLEGADLTDASGL